jgi:hypothetical protein
MTTTKAIDHDVTTALDRWAAAIGTPEHQAASEALDELLVELCRARKTAKGCDADAATDEERSDAGIPSREWIEEEFLAIYHGAGDAPLRTAVLRMRDEHAKGIVELGSIALMIGGHFRNGVWFLEHPKAPAPIPCESIAHMVEKYLKIIEYLATPGKAAV